MEVDGMQKISRSACRELAISTVSDDRREETEVNYAHEVNKEGRSGLYLAVLGTYTRRCAWVSGLLIPCRPRSAMFPAGFLIVVVVPANWPLRISTSRSRSDGLTRREVPSE